MLNRLILNTGSNLVFFVTRMAVTFFITPILVRNLGDYDYGVWELVVVVIGYMGMLDLGIRPAVSRFAAYYKSRNDAASLLSMYSTAFLYMLALGAVSFVAAFAIGIFQPEWLAQDRSNPGKYKLLLFIVGTQLLISFPGQVADSCLEGFQKYYLKNNISILFMVINTILIYRWINPANALLFVATINAVTSVGKQIIFYLLIANQAENRAYFSPGLVTKDSFRRIFSFSLKTFIQGGAKTIIDSVDKLIISFLAGVDVLVFFIIPTNLIRISRDLITTLAHAMMPVFAELHGKNEQDRARRYFINVSKYIFSVTILNAAGFLSLGGDFIRYWIGPKYGEGAGQLLTGLIPAYLIYNMNPLGNRFLTAINRHGILAKTNVVTAILVTLASILLVNEYGYVGAGFSALVPGLLVIPYVLSRTCALVKIRVAHYLRDVIVPSIVPGLLLLLFLNYFKGLKIFSSLYGILVLAVISTVGYYLVYCILSLRKEEKQVLVARMMEIRSRRNSAKYK